MAPKDWKKEKGTYAWKSEKSKDVIDIMGNPEEGYEVFLQSDEGDKTLKTFKKLTQALSYTKQYMRTH